MFGGVPSGLPALLFGARRPLAGEHLLSRLGVEDAGPDSSGSSCGSSCSPWVGTGTERLPLGPPPRAADEVLGISSSSELSGLLKGAGRWTGDPLWVAAGSGAASGLPSRSSAAQLSPRSIRRWASLLQRSTTMSTSWRTKLLVCGPRVARSSWHSVSSSGPKRLRLDMTSLSADATSQRAPRKINRSWYLSQSTRCRNRTGCSRNSNAQVWGWRLPTGALGTGLPADGSDAARPWRLWAARWPGAPPVNWVMSDGAADGAMTNSSKSLSPFTECRIDVTFLLQRGHSGLSSAHRLMHV